MEVEILNCIKHEKKLDYIKRAVVYFGELLMGKRLANNIYIEIAFEKLGKKSGEIYEAYVEVDEDDPRIRSFFIYIHDKMSLKKTISALAHEMVHVKQYARKELKDLGGSNTHWRGEIIDEDKLHYYDYPYEIEAYGREVGLVKRFECHEKTRAETTEKRNGEGSK